MTVSASARAETWSPASKYAAERLDTVVDNSSRMNWLASHGGR